jgi:gamma-glutamylcysteine synthetase
MTWWFDHHRTAFQPPALRAVFEARATDTQFFDPDAPSCAGMIARVLREREKLAVEGALAAFERALAEVRAARADVDPEVKAAARFKARRLEQLVDLARTGLGLLKVLIDSARVDAGPLKALSDSLARRP